MKSAFNVAGRVQTLPVRPVSRVATGRVWPNGNFTMGTMKAEPGGSEVLWEDGGYQLPDWVLVPDADSAGAALTSSNVPISHKAVKRRRKGLNGITAYGQQMLRSGCYLLERDYGKSDLCFATLTVPTLPAANRKKLQENWGVILNRLVQFVLRKLVEARRPPKVCGCVEVQSQRLEKFAAGYLHLHVIFPSHSNQAGRVWAVEWEEIRAWWKAAIERFAGCSLQVYPRVETATVKKSAENYIGKYLSKGGGLIDRFIELEGEDSCPKAWWFMSDGLRGQIDSETVSGQAVGEVIDMLVQTAFENHDLTAFEWVRHVDMAVGGVLKTVGWVGRLSRATADDVIYLMNASPPCNEP